MAEQKPRPRSSLPAGFARATAAVAGSGRGAATPPFRPAPSSLVPPYAGQIRGGARWLNLRPWRSGGGGGSSRDPAGPLSLPPSCYGATALSLSGLPPRRPPPFVGPPLATPPPPARNTPLPPTRAPEQPRRLRICVGGESEFIFTSHLSSQCKIHAAMLHLLEISFVRHSARRDEKWLCKNGFASPF